MHWAISAVVLFSAIAGVAHCHQKLGT